MTQQPQWDQQAPPPQQHQQQMAPPPPQQQQMGVTPTAPVNAWQTKILYDPVVPGSECCWGFFCFQCAAAKAKATMDGTHPCYNCFCWTPGGMYSWFRSVYMIKSNCGSDFMAGLFCTCCIGRRLTSEVRIRQEQGNMAGKTYPDPSDPNPNWEEDIFGCSSCGLCQACFFPCCQAHDLRQQLQSHDKEHDCCFDMCCLNPCAMYGEVRNHYKLPIQYLPPLLEDTCLPLVCMPCALNQALREAKLRESRKVQKQGGIAGVLKAVGF